MKRYNACSPADNKQIYLWGNCGTRLIYLFFRISPISGNVTLSHHKWHVRLVEKELEYKFHCNCQFSESTKMYSVKKQKIQRINYEHKILKKECEFYKKRTKTGWKINNLYLFLLLKDIKICNPYKIYAERSNPFKILHRFCLHSA